MKDSVLEKIFDGLHIYEFLKEENDPHLEELIQYFETKISADDQMLFEEMLSRQAIQAADLYPRCFALGAKMGFQLADELTEEDFKNINIEL